MLGMLSSVSSTPGASAPELDTILSRTEGLFTASGKTAGELNKIVASIRAKGAQTDLNLPRIAVIGNQSSGKSSLVEAISGINVPRDAGTCTRCPMELRLAGSDEPWLCRVSIRWECHRQGNALLQPFETPFGEPLDDLQDVERRLRLAQSAVLTENPGQIDVTRYAEKSDEELAVLVANATQKFSRNVVCVDLVGPGLPDLSFVDLPGIIQNDVEGKGEVVLVESLVKSYISPTNTIILVVLPMTDDIQNQKAAQLAREADPSGSRTIGVLTKPDAIPEGSTGLKRNYLNVLEGRAHQTRHGYYCTRQLDDAERANKLSPSEARVIEAKFFEENMPWATSSHRHRLGIVHLVQAISERLLEVIRADIPRIREEVSKQRAECAKRLEELPPKTLDPRSDVWRFATGFASAVEQAVQGSPEHAELVQANRRSYDAFAAAIFESVPPFVPLEVAPAFLSSGSQAGLPAFEVRWKRGEKAITLLEVRERIQKCVTRELPNNVPYAVKKDFIRQYQRNWATQVKKCFEEVVDALKKALMTLVDQHFGRFGNLKRAVSSIVLDLVDAHAEATEGQLRFFLVYEGNPPATQSSDLLASYRAKYLEQYREANRNRSPARMAPVPSSTPSASSPAPTFSFGQPVAVNGSSPAAKSSQPPFSFSHFNGATPAAQSSASATGDATGAAEESCKYEDELALMAEIRAYFQVSSRRFVDYVMLAIDEHLLYAFSRDLHDTLHEKLGLTQDESSARCERYLAEDPDVSALREELLAKKKRLDGVQKALYEFCQ
ncbi:P-loop containing nucleoside triphosphate hydrolase protein [Trametes polyzona]|nr:P-loop containing nucleoside triphosphate hydrolase protein [Trametes polyzona]